MSNTTFAGSSSPLVLICTVQGGRDKANKTVSLPISFSTKQMLALATANAALSSTYTYSTHVSSLTTSSVDIGAFRGTTAANDIYCVYVSIGC